jgi:hypothetical protein
MLLPAGKHVAEDPSSSHVQYKWAVTGKWLIRQ